MKRMFLSALLIISCSSTCLSQRLLQDALVKYQSKNLNGHLKSFIDGNYQKANKQLSVLNNKNLFNYKEFYINSIIYQRDYVKLKKNFNNNKSFFQPFMKFFISQIPMEIDLSKSTTIFLAKNRIVGLIGNDTINILFDTGGSGISINKKLVDKYNMQFDTIIKSDTYMPAFNYRSFESPVIIPQLTIGSMVMKNIHAKFNIENKELKDNKEIEKFDIIMGMDIFVGHIKSIKFDWVDNKMTFSNENLEQKLPYKFIFFNAKPISLMTIGQKAFTSLLDTGSPVDLIDKEVYIKNYTKKEEKKYGSFVYNEYTVPVKIGKAEISLKAVDYKPNFNLKLNDEIIDFIVGNNHKSLTFDLVNNFYKLD